MTFRYSKTPKNDWNKPQKNYLTVKITCDNLDILSMFKADLQKRLTLNYSSSIMVNAEHGIFYAYVTIENSEVAEKIQENTLSKHARNSNQ